MKVGEADGYTKTRISRKCDVCNFKYDHVADADMTVFIVKLILDARGLV